MRPIDLGNFKNKSIFLVTAGLLFLCLLSYSNALHNPFLLDDIDFLLSDTRLRDIKNVSTYFVQGISLADFSASSKQQPYYRPLAHMLALLKYQVFRDNPFGYHVFNLILLCAAGILIFWLIYLLSGDTLTAFLSAALFCVHPVHNMIVNYVAMDVAALPLVLLLVSMIAFIIQQKDQRRIMWEIISLLAFTLAMLCHEAVLIYPAYVFLVCFYYFHKNFSRSALITTPYIILVAAFLWFRWSYLRLDLHLFERMGAFSISFLEYTATYSKLLLWYISKLIFLKDTVLIYASAPVTERVLEYNVVFFLLLALCLSLLVYWRRSIRGFALNWFLIGLLPTLAGCMASPAFGFIFEPYWMLFASVGFFFLGALLLVDLSRKINKKMFVVLVAAILFSCVGITRYHNWIRKDPERYYRHWLREVPGFKLAQFHLAASLAKKGRTDIAKQIYLQTLSQDIYDYKIYSNLGLIYLSDGKLESAEEYFRQAMKLEPSSALVHNNLGAVALEQGDLPLAQKFFTKAVELDNYMIQPRLNLAKIYMQRGELDRAAGFYKEILEIDKHQHNAHLGLAQYYLSKNKKTKAFEHGRYLLENARSAPVLTNLGSIFAQHTYTNMAFACYVKAQDLDNYYKEVYLELGKLYGNQNKFAQAIAVWQDGLLVDPTDQRFKDHIEQALKLREKKLKGTIGQ